MRVRDITPRLLFGTFVFITCTSGVAAQSEDRGAISAKHRIPFGKIEADLGACLTVQKGSDPSVERGFIPVSLPSFGDTLLIDLAEFVVTVSTDYDSTEPLFIVASPATVSAAARSSSWQSEWTDLSGGFDPEFLAVIPISSTDSEMEIRIDVTEIAKHWADESLPNHGLVLKSLAESKSTFHWIRDGRYDGNDARLEIHFSRNPVAEQ